MSNSTAIRFICSSCGYRARIPAKFEGKHIKCPSCKATEQVTADDGPSTGSTVAIKRLDEGAPVEGKFRFVCTECSYRARIPLKYSGMAIKCPGCGAAQTAEAQEEQEPAGDTHQITKVDVSGGKDAEKFRFQCGSCGYRAKLPNRFKNQNIKCPGCGTAQEATPLDADAPVTGDTMVLQLVEEVPAPDTEAEAPAAETTMAGGDLQLDDSPAAAQPVVEEPAPQAPAPTPAAPTEAPPVEDDPATADAAADPNAPLHFDPFADERKQDETPADAQDLLAELRNNAKTPAPPNESRQTGSSRRIAVPGTQPADEPGAAASEAPAGSPPPPPPPPVEPAAESGTSPEPAPTVDPVAATTSDAEDRKATVADAPPSEASSETSGPVPILADEEDEDTSAPAILPGTGSHAARTAALATDPAPAPASEPAKPPPPPPPPAAEAPVASEVPPPPASPPQTETEDEVPATNLAADSGLTPTRRSVGSGSGTRAHAAAAAEDATDRPDKKPKRSPRAATDPEPAAAAEKGGKAGLVVLVILLLGALAGAGYLFLELQKQTERANTAETDLATERQNLEATKDELTTTSAELATTTDKLAEAIESLDLKTEALSAAEAAKEQLQTTLTTTKAELEQAASDLQSKARELADTEALKTKAEAAQQAAEAKVEQLGTELDELQTKLDGLMKDAAKFKSGGMSLKVAADQAEADKKKAEAEAAAAKQELAELKKQLDELKQAAGEQKLKEWGLLPGGD